MSDWDGFFYNGGKYEVAARSPDLIITIDFYDLYIFDPEIGMMLIKNPDKGFEAIRAYLRPVVDFNGNPTEKKIRIINLTETTNLRSINEENIGQLIQVEGIITAVSIPEPEPIIAAFICSRCGEVLLESQDGFTLRSPKKCTGPKCHNRNFSPDDIDRKLSTYRYLQRIEVQERPEELPPGEIPESLTVQLQDDLIRTVSPGDRAKIVGVFEAVPLKPRKLDYTKILISNSVIVENKDFDIDITEEELKQFKEISESPNTVERIVYSFAPSIYGWGHIKEVLMLSIFGGVAKNKNDSDVRGNLNVLMLGDPGTAKSQLLRYCHKVSHRSVFSTGRGVTGVGLTAALVRENERFVLRAGSMALADMGVCCIAEGQMVVMENGLKKIENINIGDSVLSMDGLFTPVSNKWFNGVKDTVKISLYTGDEIICTPDHKIMTQKGWKIASELTESDYIKIPCCNIQPIIDEDEFEIGIIHGFGLSDIYLNEKSPKNTLTWSSSKKHLDRTDYMIKIIEKHYGKTPHFNQKKEMTTECWGQKINWSSGVQVYFASPELKEQLYDLFHYQKLYMSTHSYKLGLLAGILSTDACVSHKQGKWGVKHEINMGLGRNKYNDEWLLDIMKLVNSVFHQFGILSVIRKRCIIISSLRSYNRVVDLLAGRLVGKNNKKLYSVTPKSKVPSYDGFLDDEYVHWFEGIKWNHSYAVKHGLSSRIWGATKREKVSMDLMETLKPHWGNLTGIPYKSPTKNYIFNPVKKIDKHISKKVYDLTIANTHCFTISGGLIHNCIDEGEKMKKEDRDSIHTPMEQQIIPIQKGGLNTTLNARCATLMAVNPTEGRYNQYKTIPENIKDFPESLLSRFDFIFVMPDIINEKNDLQIANRILQLETKPQKDKIPFTILKKYIIYSKRFNPTIPPEVSEYLREQFLDKRKIQNNTSGLQVSWRQLESLERACEARSRAHHRETVTMQDAEATIKLFEIYVQATWTDPFTGKIDMSGYEGMPATSRVQQAEYVPRIVEQMYRDGKGNVGLDGELFVRRKDLIDEMKRMGELDGYVANQVLEMALKKDLVWPPGVDKIKITGDNNQMLGADNKP